MHLKDLLRTKIGEEKKRVQNLVKTSGDTKIGDITISHLFRGMRGLKVLHTDISYVDADEGIRMRGFTIFELLEKLPRPAWSEVPYLGGHGSSCGAIFHLRRI
jgi:citrate synthase